MHFEFLVEDVSGKRALDLLVPKLIGEQHTFEVHAYKGIGRIPKNLNAKSDPSKRILLDRLPQLLKGYGRTFHGYGNNFNAVLVVVCDLDDKCLKDFRNELLAVLANCDPVPTTRFCIAVEEGESWLLGDKEAVKMAYPTAKTTVLDSYTYDSICGTWEKLADAVFLGGTTALSALGWQRVGAEKSAWAINISPHIRIDANQSPSFKYFVLKLRELLDQ